MVTEKGPKVFFVLGGPGSGKGTACTRLVEDFGYTHFSAGDLLRNASKDKSTEVAQKISQVLMNGGIVPSELTVALLENAIKTHPNPRGYVIDGFPRKMDQMHMFEEQIARAKIIFYLDCSETTMEERLLGRASQCEGRDDDNLETIRRRFRTNAEQCMPVVEHYREKGLLHTIDSNRSRDEVYNDMKRLFINYGEEPLQK
uniref:Putative adenylate kinase n=1 Tax=Trypanosoma congolense (strain IL3000) TaxID=1068625 RepID=G0UU31_TRYCI|nr:putative adenylate kinase [Trypanosoma congolense IL3000]